MQMLKNFIIKESENLKVAIFGNLNIYKSENLNIGKFENKKLKSYLYFLIYYLSLNVSFPTYFYVNQASTYFK